MLLGWLTRGWLSDAGAHRPEATSERPAEAEILSRIGRIEAALTTLASRGSFEVPAVSLPAISSSREPVGETSSATALDSDELSARVAELTRAMDELQQIARTTSRGYASGTALRDARDPDRAALDVLIDLHHAGHHAELQRRVEGLSQQDILQTYGWPDEFSEGYWSYDAASPENKLTFRFIADFVRSVYLGSD